VPVRHWTGPLDVLYYLPEALGWEKTAWPVEHTVGGREAESIGDRPPDSPGDRN